MLTVEVATDPRKEGLSSDDILGDAVAEFSYFLCTEDFADGLASSTAVVYFSGILGFSPDGYTFERPRNYTPKLSALIHCIRLCMLERCLPRFAHPSIEWEVRPRVGGLKRFILLRDRYLCHGCQSPTGELLSLRSYGRAFSRSDGPSFRVNWDDDSQTVRWDNGALTLGQLRSLGCRALERAKISLHRLLYGVVPDLKLDRLRDKMSNMHNGYSFVQDPSNDLGKAYLQLYSRACLDPADGLMSSESWKMDAVRRYLKEEMDLLINIMLIMFLRGGQAPRTTEFLSIECYNGPSTPRGLYIHDGSLAYVTRHSKARRTTNQEFNVVRYLPEEDSQLIVNYLTYVRPFVAMLNRLCCGLEQDRRLLFASSHNAESHWKSDALTSALKKITADVVGTSFGVQIYRQLSIAVTEKHVKQIEQPFNRYDDTTVGADIGVVFAWQSGHRPMQRGTSYGIDGAYPDSLQPALLRIYRWASRQWHEFLEIQDPSSSTNKQVVERGYFDQAAVNGSGAVKRRTTDTRLGRNISMRSRSPARLSEALVTATSNSRTHLDLDLGEEYLPPWRGHRSDHVGFSARLDGQDYTIESVGTQTSRATSRSHLSQSPTPSERRTGETPVCTASERHGPRRTQRLTKSPLPSFPWSVQSSQFEEPRRPCTLLGPSVHSDWRQPVTISHSHEDDKATPHEDSPIETSGIVNHGVCSTSCDLGDLVRTRHDALRKPRRSTISISCEKSLLALRELSKRCRDQILELSIPRDLMATDDADNNDYEKELCEYIINEMQSVNVITLSMPNDLAVSTEKDGSEYEYHSWTIHEMMIDALKSRRLATIRFSHPKKYGHSFSLDDLYRMHNVSNYMRRMLLGAATEDAMWGKQMRLIRSRRHGDPPSAANSSPILFALCRALDREAVTKAGYSITCGGNQEHEVGTIINLQREPFTARLVEDACDVAVTWWESKCPVCIGDGLPIYLVGHPLKQCPRENPNNFTWPSRQHVFIGHDGDSRLCETCLCPQGRYDAFRDSDESEATITIPEAHSHYSNTIYTVIIELYKSHCGFYRELLNIEMCLGKEEELVDREMLRWLVGVVPECGIIYSRTVQVFLMLTWAAQGRREVNI